MKNVELRPVVVKHTNGSLKGFDDIPDLPITNVFYSDNIRGVVSVWKASLWARIKFLFDGRVNLSVHGTTHPPANISLGVAFETK
jgi:hypothetical protein